MTWIVTGIINVIMKLIADALNFILGMFTNMQLDIGRKPVDLLDADGNTIKASSKGLYETVFGTNTSFNTIIISIAIGLIALIFIIKAFSMLRSDEPNESIVSLFVNSMIAGILVVYIKDIFVFLEGVINPIYLEFRTILIGVQDDMEIAQKTFDVDIDEIGLGVGFVVLIISFALMISIIKFILEAFLRYVILGIMYTTSPLAMSAYASKESRDSIFKAWGQMLGSQFLLMILNLIILALVARGLITLGNGSGLGDTPESLQATKFVQELLLILGMVVVGQSLDEYLKNLGLSVANTGQGLSSAVIGGAMMATGTLRGAVRAGKTAVKAGKGAVKAGSKLGGAAAGIATGAGMKEGFKQGIGRTVANGKDGLTDSQKSKNAFKDFGSFSKESNKNARQQAEGLGLNTDDKLYSTVTDANGNKMLQATDIQTGDKSFVGHAPFVNDNIIAKEHVTPSGERMKVGITEDTARRDVSYISDKLNASNYNGMSWQSAKNGDMYYAIGTDKNGNHSIAIPSYQSNVMNPNSQVIKQMSVGQGDNKFTANIYANEGKSINWIKEGGTNLQYVNKDGSNFLKAKTDMTSIAKNKIGEHLDRKYKQPEDILGKNKKK